MVQTTLKVDGMMCSMCESHVNEVVRKTAQVEKVTSSHTKGETVIVSAQPLDIEALKAAIADTAASIAPTPRASHGPSASSTAALSTGIRAARARNDSLPTPIPSALSPQTIYTAVLRGINESYQEQQHRPAV